GQGPVHREDGEEKSQERQRREMHVCTSPRGGGIGPGEIPGGIGNNNAKLTWQVPLKSDGSKTGPACYTDVQFGVGAGSRAAAEAPPVRLGTPELPEVGTCAEGERIAGQFGGPARLAGPTTEPLGTRRECDRNQTGIRPEYHGNASGMRRSTRLLSLQTA